MMLMVAVTGSRLPQVLKLKVVAAAGRITCCSTYPSAPPGTSIWRYGFPFWDGRHGMEVGTLKWGYPLKDPPDTIVVGQS
jgi:hypothetical protein